MLAHRWSSVDFGIVPTGLHPWISKSSLVICTVLGAVKILCSHLLVYGCILNDLFLNHIIILNTESFLNPQSGLSHSVVMYDAV